MYIAGMIELLIVALICLGAFALVARFADSRRSEGSRHISTREGSSFVEPAWTEEIGRCESHVYGRASRINDDAISLDNAPPPMNGAK